MATFTPKICEWFHLADGTTSLLDESDGETDPAPQEDEKEEKSGEKAGEQDREDEPGVSQSHQILEEVGSPVHLLKICWTFDQKQVILFNIQEPGRSFWTHWGPQRRLPQIV